MLGRPCLSASLPRPRLGFPCRGLATASPPPRSFGGLDKRALARRAGAFAVLFTVVVGAARNTAATSEAKAHGAVVHKRQMHALDAVERSARTFCSGQQTRSVPSDPAADRDTQTDAQTDRAAPDAVPWDEAKLGQLLRRAQLVPSDVGLHAGPEPPGLEGPVSWTAVIMGRNWSSVAVRDKLRRAYTNARADMPLLGTGREMSHDDEMDELHRLQQAQADDEQYAERLFAAYEALEEKRRQDAAEAARTAEELAARQAEEQQRRDAEAKERQAAQLRELAMAYEKADMRELALEYEERQQKHADSPPPGSNDTPVPPSSPPETEHTAQEPRRAPPPKRTYF